jgi:hypothetical protein
MNDVADDAKALESLTTLTVHVDHENQVHAFADPHAQWKLLTPLSIEALIEVYNELLEDAGDGLTALDIQVDHTGQVHTYTDAYATWRFITPVPVRALVETYKAMLANVVMEVKADHNAPSSDPHRHDYHRR